jgi:hypothetical protein
LTILIGLAAVLAVAAYEIILPAIFPPIRDGLLFIRDGLLFLLWFIRDEVLSLISDFGVLTTTIGVLLLMVLVIRLFSSFIWLASVSALAIYAYLNWPRPQITTVIRDELLFIHEKALSFDRGVLTTTLGVLLLMLLVIGRNNPLRSAVYSSLRTIVGGCFGTISSRLEVQTNTILPLLSFEWV